MSITIGQALELYKLGMATVGHGGKVYFRKEKGYRVQPTASSSN